MKKIMLISLVLVLGLAVNAFAVSEDPLDNLEGTISGPSNGLYGTDGWSNATFQWVVTQVDGNWKYEYTFTAERKALSHIIIQVSEDFDASNILDSTDNPLLGTYSGANPSNPGMPGEFKGIKWNDGEGTSFTVWILTDRAPMWGNFYAKDGTDSGADVYAWSGDVDGFWDNIIVPDTETYVPEPSTLLLVGTGLLGLGLYGRRKFRK